MSSMRNVVQRRNHKERAQPLEREKWGVLEKHKDYSLRAKDYNEKKARLKILRQKAADRNPDEFHYGMLSSKTSSGKKAGDRGNRPLSHEAVKLLKTQDAAYLQSTIQRTAKAIEKLEQEFILGEDQAIETQEVEAPSNRYPSHLLFAETPEDQRMLVTPNRKQEALEEDSQPSLEMEVGIDQPTTKTRRQLEKELLAEQELRTLQDRRKKEQINKRAKLASLKLRMTDLMDAERELDLQRAKMSNSVGGVNKNGKKWRIRERKK